MKYFSILLLFIIPFLGFAQTTFKGKVIDATTKAPIPFVNVGIVGKDKGTVTDDKGNFSLVLPDALNNDTLRISMMGYNARSWKVSTLKNITDEVIALQQADYQLPPIEVSSKVWKTKVLGNETTTDVMTGSFTSNELGNEVGVKIKVGKKPVHLQSFNFTIARNVCKNGVLRVNIYSLKDDLPDSNLLQASLVVNIPERHETHTVDLKPYQLVLTEDFVVAVEYIRPCPSNTMQFSAAFLGTIYSRITSQGSWEKVKGFDLGFNVQVKY